MQDLRAQAVRLSHGDDSPGAGRLEVGPMKRCTKTIRRFFGDEDGPSATEYAILLALIMTGAIAILTTFGDRVQGIYDAIAGAVDGA